LVGNVTLILLTWRIGRVPKNASKWQTGFNSEFKGVMVLSTVLLYYMESMEMADWPKHVEKFK